MRSEPLNQPQDHLLQVHHGNDNDLRSHVIASLSRDPAPRLGSPLAETLCASLLLSQRMVGRTLVAVPLLGRDRCSPPGPQLRAVPQMGDRGQEDEEAVWQRSQN